jgi:YkoP-like protein
MQFVGPAGGRRRHALPERIVFAIDAALRRWNSVVEFTSDPTCILRIRVGRLERPLVLADGTCGRAGERFVELHLWNEHIPAMPKEGASIAWARQMHLSFQHSLQQLVRHLATRPDLADIAVVRCTLMFASAERDAQMARLLGHYGFELVPGASALTLSEHVRRFGENIQISLVVLTRNRAALRRDTLRRGRTRMFMSRRALEQRYGGAGRLDH